MSITGIIVAIIVYAHALRISIQLMILDIGGVGSYEATYPDHAVTDILLIALPSFTGRSCSSSNFRRMSGTALDDPCLDHPVKALEDLSEYIARLDEPDREEDTHTDLVEIAATNGVLLQTGR